MSEAGLFPGASSGNFLLRPLVSLSWVAPRMLKRSSHVWDERFFYFRYRIISDEEKKEKKMNTQTDTKMNVNGTETPTETDNPMQERHINEVAESVEATAEDILTARRLEVREEAGSAFVP